MLRMAWLPIAFLLFAIPLPYFVDSQISWRLQLLSSTLGVAVLRALGYAVYLEGNVIDLGVYKLQVVEACSGLRYLYPLLSIGFLMAYMYPAALRWRVLVFLSTIPITVLTKRLRVGMGGGHLPGGGDRERHRVGPERVVGVGGAHAAAAAAVAEVPCVVD